MNDLFLKAIERIAYALERSMVALEKQNELTERMISQNEIVLVTGTLPDSEPPKDEGGN